MLEPVYTNQFKKDVKKIKRRKKDTEKLKELMQELGKNRGGGPSISRSQIKREMEGEEGMSYRSGLVVDLQNKGKIYYL